MTATVEERDRVTAGALAWVAIVLVAGWTAVALLDGALRVVESTRSHAAVLGLRSWSPALPLGLELLLGYLWVIATAGLALGAAVAVAALVLERPGLRRAALLLGLTCAGGAGQFLLLRLAAGRVWSYGATHGTGRYAGFGAVVVPVVVLVGVYLLLRSALGGRRRATPPAPEA